MFGLVGYLLLFVLVGIGFIFVHLLAGKFIRPARPDAEKQTIYECGEPTIGSAWVQFDLRFYVIALLFVVFDVEVAFFFPWAIVFGQANTLANDQLPAARRVEAFKALAPDYPETANERERVAGLLKGEPETDDPHRTSKEAETQLVQKNAHDFAWLAFGDILVFFGVILVGFAYLWRRGDLAWVRSTAAEKVDTVGSQLPLAAPAARPLVGVGR